MVSLIALALDILRQGRPLVEATVIRRQGSAPRGAGAKMIIDVNGLQKGTIGGGIMEARVLEKAQRVLETGHSQIVAFDLAGADVEDADMVCGGHTEVLVDCVYPGPATIELFERRLSALEEVDDSHYVTLIRGGEEHCATERLVLADALEAVDITGLPPVMRQDIQQLSGSRAVVDVLTGAGFTLVAERLQCMKTVYFFGAGHVVFHTAVLAARVGFRVVVVDDRETFANQERFPYVAEIRVIQDFKDAFSECSVGPSDFIIIATRGHLHDKTVLAQALAFDACYIGMIGSVRRRDMLYAALVAEGVSRQDLDRVYSPVGLPIAAETPEEIGISIVAQMIQVRAENR